MNKDSIDKLARRLAASLPQGLRAMREDVEDNFRAVLKSSLARMDLVTREEFEVQEAVLARTRQKLDDIEKRLADFEQAASAGKAAKAPAKSAASKKTGKKVSKKAGKKTSK
jgi:ubiquinone biosynthesis accessory factor UbiK